MPCAPENSLNGGASWTFLRAGNSEVSAILNDRWEDRTWFSAPAGPVVPGAEFYSRPSFGLLDARLSWQMEFANESRARIDLWGKNVTDEEWRSHVIGNGGPISVRDPLGTFTPAGYTGQAIAWAERPIYGINLIYEF